MNLKERIILEEYRRERVNFEKLADVASEKLRGIVAEVGAEIIGLEYRVKSESSLAGKLYKNGDLYKTFADLTDILGARIICFFTDDVEKLGKLVEREFEIDWENSSNKRELLQADRFGYLSLHYIAYLPTGSGYPDEICGMDKRFEIQIRTGLQHVWAAINHDIAYKSKFGVPEIVVREFSRLAGLLELADDEFLRLRNVMADYVADIHEKIINHQADDVAIDMVSIREFMLYNDKMRKFLQQLADIEGSEIKDIDPESYIQQLAWLGKKTLGDLQNMLTQNQELAYNLAYNVLNGTELDILSSSVGLRFLCRAELLLKGYDMDQTAEFIALSLGDKTRGQRQAKRLFDVYDKIKGVTP